MTTLIIDNNDLIKFAPLARKSAFKKGLLKEIKIGLENPKATYHCLFGNLLYGFDSETDPNSLSSIFFLEGCTCKITNTADNVVLAITLVGGKKVSFSSASSSSSPTDDLQEWLDFIEANKHVQITRKIDDYESNLLQLQHKTEQNEAVHAEYEQTIAELQKQLKELTAQQQATEESLQQTQREKNDLAKRLKETEGERLLLLKSRGITPKTLPLWALQDSNQHRKGILNPIDKLKLWTGTWNLGGKEPFVNIPIQKATSLLLPFIPSGYDIYVLAVQDCPSEAIFECVDALLVAEGCRRFRLETENLVNQGTSQRSSEEAHSSNPNHNQSSDSSKIISRSDGRFHGIVMYIKCTLFSEVKLLSIANICFLNTKYLQGAIAAAISIAGRTIVFVNGKFDHKSNETRREQYQSLIISLGELLAERGYHLPEQFHHIIWLGDFSFKLVDTSGNEMSVETILNMLSDPRLVRTLFDTHDQLNQEKKLHNIFYGCREPIPYPNFYPTYKKIEHRPPVNYSRPDWAKNTYKTMIKDSSFFLGGKVKEYTPQFSDRILFYSMSDLAEDLLPEALPSEMYILRTSKDDNHPTTISSNTNSSNNNTASNANNYLTTVMDSAKLSVQVDNYRSVNDGEGLTASDHSPVFCTFLLRVRHDHSSLIEQKQKMQSKHGDINDVLSVLTNTSGSYTPSNAIPIKRDDDEKVTATTSLSTSLAKSPTKRSYLIHSEIEDEPPRTPSKGNKSDHSALDDKKDMSAAPFSPFSLLPHGIYHVRISEMKLIWGVNEEFPVNLQLLFPAPYEATAGERFAEYRLDDGYLFPMLGSKSGSAHRTVGGIKNNNHSSHPPAGVAAELGLNQWKRLGASKSGTCLRLGIDRTAETASSSIPNLILTWKGDEPLDRLHICFKAAMMSKSTIVTPTRGTSSRSSGKVDLAALSSIDADDKIVGHCSISLEQLCKVALANAATAASTASVAAPRILIHRGRPMHNLDGKTLQREIVTFCCRLELLL